MKKSLSAFAGSLAVLFLGTVLGACSMFQKTVTVKPELARTMTEAQARNELIVKSQLYYLIATGQEAILRGDLDRAREAFSALAKIDDANSEVHTILAEIYIHDGDLNTALTHAARAYDLDPSDQRNAVLLAGLYTANGQLEQAIKIYRAVIAKDPNDEEIPLLLAATLTVKKEFKEAQSVLKDYVKRHPDSPAGYFELGRLQLIQDDCEGSKPYFEKAARIDPKFSRAELALGFCAEVKGDTQDAIAHYEKSLESDPDNSVLRSHLVKLHLRENDIDKAKGQNEKLDLFQFNKMFRVVMSRVSKNVVSQLCDQLGAPANRSS